MMKEGMKDEEACKRKCMYKSLGLLALRLVFLLWMLHGIQKLTSIDATAGFFGQLGIPMPGLMAWVVALVETFGSLAVVLGLGTRYAAGLLAFTMVVAILTAHLPSVLSAGLPYGLLKIELPFLYLMISLAMVLIGPGKYSLDKMFFCKNCENKKC